MKPSHKNRPACDHRLAVGLLGCIAALAAIGPLAASASASGALPVAPTATGATGSGLQVKPSTIIYTGDGSGFLGGARVGDGNSPIQWWSWTSDRAAGLGFNELNNCNPSCAGGTYHLFKVKIVLWRPRTVAGTLVFTRMTIFYKHHRPAGEPRHYTFTDIHADNGGFSWSPPVARGYCFDTYGQPPFAGCRNIHSLP